MINKITKVALMPFFLMAIIVFPANNKVFAQTRRQLEQITVLAQNASGDKFAFETKSGARVYGVNKLSAQMLAAIDRGLTDLFVVARKNNFTKRLNYSDYRVFIARADRTKDAAGKYSPDFAIGAAQYAGTNNDKDGYIYAAGIIVSLNQPALHKN